MMSSVRGLGRWPRRWRLDRFALVVCMLAGAALFSAAGAAAAPRSPQRRASSTATAPGSGLLGLLQSLPAATSGCSWQGQFGNGGKTALDTDTYAAYWATSYFALPGSVMTIQGAFPQARNMSFTVYHLSAVAGGGHLVDAQIQPATGVNPFQQGQSGTGTYTLQILDAPAPANPAPNTLYTGAVGPVDVELVYRVYDPTDLSSPAGEVQLPQTTITLDGNTVATNQPCVGSGLLGLGLGRAGAALAAPAVARPAAAQAPASAAVHPAARAQPSSSPAARPNSILPRPEPTWVAAKASLLYADPDNAYLRARIEAAFGQLVVFQAQMPTFPDSNAGDPVWTPAQVRYWSICENSGLFPVVVGCAADFNTVQSNGVATFVISTPSNRPTNATAADGVNWLPWGSSSYGIVLYRQMLADPSFSQSIASIPPGGSLSATMGPYYPNIAYCSVAEFEAAGAAGCLGSSSSFFFSSSSSGSG